MSAPQRPDDAPPPWAAGTDTRLAELFPTLSDAHIDLMCRGGVEEYFGHGEWLWHVGDRGRPLYVVLEGSVDAVQRHPRGDSVVATFTPRQFTGETSMTAGRAALIAGRAELSLELMSGETARARAVIVASGVIYRHPEIPGIERFIGSGVHYAASYLESLIVRGEDVAILGGGNSAGQAAVYLSGFARHVYVLVRGRGLADSMSRYLIHRIENTPNITLLAHTQLVAAEGAECLERVRWKNSVTGEESVKAVHHVFVFIGATPCTYFLDPTIATDANGYVKTGPALAGEELALYGSATAARQPQFLETSWPNVFAVGDVRSGSLKRVASGVGEGAAAIALVHQALSG